MNTLNLKTPVRTDVRPTIRDVAGACGVSEATVSYVLNGKRTLRAETRERVLLAMREMNYHPSAVARGLSSKRVRTLGILLGAIHATEFVTNPYVSGLLSGIMLRAQRECFDITFFTASWQGAMTSAPPLRDGRSDGILTISPQLDSDIIAGLTQLNIPVVAISAGGAVPVDNVDVDSFAGVQMAVRHLLELGHRRIAYLSGDIDMASYAPRRAGLLDALDSTGGHLRPELILESRFDGSLAYDQSRAILMGPHPPTAFCCGNDRIALGVLEAARSLNISVPTELSIIGFDDMPEARYSTPQLSTVAQPLRQIGEAATSLLIQRVTHPGGAPTTVLLPPQLIVRGSTAPVSNAAAGNASASNATRQNLN